MSITNPPRKDNFDMSSSADNRKDNMSNFNSEVDRICRNGIPTPSATKELYNKYPNDESFVDKVLRACAKRNRKITKLARKVAQKVKAKYEATGRPMHEILERMTKYKVDNKWSDMQYSLFTQELTKLLSPMHTHTYKTPEFATMYALDKSRISRTLGLPEVSQGKLKIKESEHGILNEILSMYKSSMQLYNNSMMTNLMYSDTDLVALTGKFDRKKNIASNHIHPVIAALFLPKFDLLEYHMLYSNIGRIVECRHEEKPISTEPDSLLFYDMVVDPNDVVCDTNSPITDLRNRFKVQIKLWKTVQNLRSGLYYDDAPISEFIGALNACRNNLYDNADLAFNQDEGSILKRLMSVFSLRPIMLKTTPLSSLSAYFGYNMMQGQSPYGFNSAPVVTITCIPFISVQIPPHKEGVPDDLPKSLKGNMQQTLWLSEGKTIVAKEQSVIHTRELLIFYVNRRYQTVRVRTFVNPLQFDQLPLTLNSFSRVNPYPLEVDDIIDIGEDQSYELRSVVAVTDTTIKKAGHDNFYVTGCIALIAKKRSDNGGYDNRYFRYDPIGASIPIVDESNDIVRINNPISEIPISGFTDENNPNPNEFGFNELACTRGTIYIYAKPSGYDRNAMIYTYA